jgi:hypothetical protein
MEMTERLTRRASTRRSTILGAFALIAVVALALVVAIRTTGGGNNNHPRATTRPSEPFAPSSVWNAPVPANAPLSPHSPAYVSQLEQQVTHYGPWINTTQYSVPVYTVTASQRRVPVVLDTSGGSADLLSREFRQGVPIPDGAEPAAGTDRHMVVWQPSRNALWEFWGAQDENGTWHARWGGEITDVSRNPGYYPSPSNFGATGTSLSLLGGLMRIGELRSGHLDHALALAIPHAAAGTVAFPAQRTDGNVKDPNAIPEGTRFRLDPRLNIESMRLPTMTKMIALAAQRYGMIVRDQSGSVSLYGEDPTPTGANPYGGPNGLYGGLNAAQIMRAFPWQHLQVVQPSRASSGAH